jgi:hypothetical protein
MGDFHPQPTWQSHLHLLVVWGDCVHPCVADLSLAATNTSQIHHAKISMVIKLGKNQHCNPIGCGFRDELVDRYRQGDI